MIGLHFILFIFLFLFYLGEETKCEREMSWCVILKVCESFLFLLLMMIMISCKHFLGWKICFAHMVISQTFFIFFGQKPTLYHYCTYMFIIIGEKLIPPKRVLLLLCDLIHFIMIISSFQYRTMQIIILVRLSTSTYYS